MINHLEIRIIYTRCYLSSGPASGVRKQLNQVGPPKPMGLKKNKLSLIPTPHLNKKIYVTSFSFFGTGLSFF